MSDLPARLRRLSAAIPKFVDLEDQDQAEQVVDTLWAAAEEIEGLSRSAPYMPASVGAAPPMGCICPPTSEQTCDNPICPRRGPNC